MKLRLHKNAGLIAILGALMLLAAIINGVLDRRETIDDWYIVAALSVPDHTVSDTPIIEFERHILKPLSGRWSVETQQLKGTQWETVCRGVGLSNYSPDEVLPEKGVTLGWFRGKCEKTKGTFRLQVIWEFTDADTGETKARIVTTDAFTVTE
jgi:hypothetical protein